jgi:hypothetical protein
MATRAASARTHDDSTEAEIKYAILSWWYTAESNIPNITKGE